MSVEPLISIDRTVTVNASCATAVWENSLMKLNLFGAWARRVDQCDIINFVLHTTGFGNRLSFQQTIVQLFGPFFLFSSPSFSPEVFLN